MTLVDEDFIWVPATRLLGLTPLDRPFWIDVPVYTEEVWAAVDEGRLRDLPVPPGGTYWNDPENHAERVAFFVVHGLDDHDVVEIDVGVPEMGLEVRNPVQDGNHRLAGALLRGDKFVPCSIAGSESEVKRRFGWRVAADLFAPHRMAA